MALCPTRAAGRQDEIPKMKKKPPLEEVREAAVVVCRRNKVLILRRGEGGRWAGMWDFPRFTLTTPAGDCLERELIEKVGELTGLVVQPERHLTTIKHGVTRFRITLDCHQARYLRRGKSTVPATEMRWLRPDELEQFPLSVSGRKLGRLIAEQAKRGAMGGLPALAR